MRKPVGKCRFWSNKVWNFKQVSHETLVLRLQHVSLRFSGFLVAWPCLWGKPQNLWFSNVFKQVQMSFCMAGMTLCDIPTCFKTCQKSLCVAGAILWRRFQKTGCMSRGRRSTWETSIVIARGRRRHVVLHVFCESHCQGWVTCKLRSRRGILRDVSKIDWSLARNIVFEVVGSRVHEKTRG